MVKKTKSQMAPIDEKYIDKRYSSLKDALKKWEKHFKAIRDYVIPYCGSFEEKDISEPKDLGSEMLDTAPWNYAELAASGLVSGIANPAEQWFSFSDPSIDPVNKKNLDSFLDQHTDVVAGALERCGFYHTLRQAAIENVCFATSATLVEDNEDDPEYPFSFRTFTVGEFSFSMGKDNKPNSFVYDSYLTARQVVDLYDLENHEKKDEFEDLIRKAEEGDTTGLFKVVHYIEKAEKREVEFKNYAVKNKKPCLSVHFLEDKKDFPLRVGGYDEFPVAIARWSVISTITFGVSSPGWKAVAESKQLQVITEDELLALAKETEPPVSVNDAVDEINSFPGGITRVNSTDGNVGVKPLYQVQVNYAQIDKTREEKRNTIKEIFYYDLFMMLTTYGTREMTADEVASRNGEKLSMIEPIVNNMLDYISQLLERVSKIMERKGLTPPKPEGIGEVKLQFHTVYEEARKKMANNTTMSFVQSVGTAAQLIGPAMSAVDGFELLDSIANNHSCNRFIIPKEEWQKGQEEQAAQMQEANAMDQLEKGSGIAKDLARAKTDEPNALTSVMGQMGMQSEQGVGENVEPIPGTT